MKNLTKIISIVTLILLTSQVTLAGKPETTDEDMLIVKHREHVEKAKPNDWKTPAMCVNELVSYRIKSEEALNWINRSIEIKETVFNRVVKGDYYLVMEEVDKAQNEYIRAINLAREEGKNELIPDIQWKVLVAMGVKNYLDFHSSQN